MAGQLLVRGANVFRESGGTCALKRGLQIQAFGQSGRFHQLWIAEDVGERRSPVVHPAKQARDVLERAACRVHVGALVVFLVQSVRLGMLFVSAALEGTQLLREFVGGSFGGWRRWTTCSRC